MKLKLVVILALFLTTILAQVVIDSNLTTITRQRVVSGVYAQPTTNGLVMTANFSMATLDGTNVISTSLLKTITLSGTNLDNYLTQFNLPKSAVLQAAFEAMWQNVYTNTP